MVTILIANDLITPEAVTTHISLCLTGYASFQNC